jgi:electron transport complex protein RnfB
VDSGTALVARIDALLPQTQCTRCGFPTCGDYAQAVATGKTGINRCPPGGQYTIDALAAVTGRAPRALDPACGVHAPRRVAKVDEAWCIGCTLCIQACPVDALLGGAKRMHTVVEPLCTGCELCIAPCPVDCIEMVAPATGPRTPKDWLSLRAPAMRQRHLVRRQRLAAIRSRREAARRQRRGEAAAADRKARIAAAVARRRARRAGAPS